MCFIHLSPAYILNDLFLVQSWAFFAHTNHASFLYMKSNHRSRHRILIYHQSNHHSRFFFFLSMNWSLYLCDLDVSYFSRKQLDWWDWVFSSHYIILFFSELFIIFRFLGFKKTIQLDKKHLVGLIDQYNNGSFSWDDFSSVVKEAHATRMGSPKKRIIIADRPKEEDYFYANPYECLQLLDEPWRSTWCLHVCTQFKLPT